MAIRLLVALIALGLLHVAPQLASWRRDSVFRRWVAQLSDTSGAGRVCWRWRPRCCCARC